MYKPLLRIILTIAINTAFTAYGIPASDFTRPDSIIWHNPADAGHRTVGKRTFTTDTTPRPMSVLEALALCPESCQPAMLQIVSPVVFFTDAKEIMIRATPVINDSGRLYHVDRDGIWHLCQPAGTVPYQAYHTKDKRGVSDEYRYYPPQTHHVGRIDIGTEPEARLLFAEADTSRPIVIYGSGGHRDARQEWINTLQRNLDLPVMSLTRSDSVTSKPDLTAMIGKIPARLYILDFTGDTDAGQHFQTAAITDAINEIHRHNRSTPILVVSDNDAARTVCDSLNGDTSVTIHYLPTPDARRRAQSVETGAREILGMRQGTSPTCIEVSQRRDIGAYDWHQRHLDICHYIDSARPGNLLIGNSIVHFWGGSPGNTRVNGPETWRNIMKPEGFVNMGCGWDKIENVLWRVYHGEIDGTDAENIVVMIGTNNIAFNTPDEIAEGIGHLVEAIGMRQPDARIILAGLLPRRSLEPTVATINVLLKQIATEKGALYINPGIMMLQSDGKIDESLFIDGLHPNDKGYAIIAPQIIAAMKR